jgi:hypothetical protein
MILGVTAASIGPLSAHKASDSYLILQVGSKEVTGQWEIALRDLDYALGIDTNNDGIITWGELRSHHLAIADYMLSRLKLVSEGKDCPTRVTDQLVADHSDGSYEVLRFAAECGSSAKELEVVYDFFFDFDAQHRGLLRLSQMEQPIVLSLVRPAQPGIYQKLFPVGAKSLATIFSKASGTFGQDSTMFFFCAPYCSHPYFFIGPESGRRSPTSGVHSGTF